MNLDFENRSQALLEILRAHGEIRTVTSAEELGVSQMTIRRDLAELERLGLVRLVRGGAKPADARPFSTRNVLFDAEKWVVAKKVARLVPKTGTIAIDSSTTMARLCKILPSGSGLTVVTNSLISFQTLQSLPGVTALLTGGLFDVRSDSLVGSNCQQFIAGFAFDIYFASTAAFSPSRGGFESTQEEAAVKAAFVRSSAKVVVGVNSQKLDDHAPFASFSTSEIDVLCGDQDPSFWAGTGLSPHTETR
ncbi:DeoR/GlpR family DNA-binding transcription regulator [Propionicicella superfundia]|uniref:DeoR/GlpR family DNA-binding transcription regulator n=1 Tax=Propionicicella superfundia TaxID=348582 RepID=UPI0004213274|nr:DeoR/GlpR family DNA-binding transcription regulator [Propionicicella superfundia]